MGCLRPATPGFITTLAATVLLTLVVLCVPYFKSIYFLRASVSDSGISGTLTLGTLGYCYEFSGNSTCSKPSVGYELDPNSLVGNNTSIKIPTVVVKWLTYALVLHIVALVSAAISALFGLLAHVREMSMSCFSTCISGFSAAICLLAFIFDIIFFFVVKGRINKVNGGSATIGSAIWLTLIAWILLFFSGCAFRLGRCCIGSRGPDYSRKRKDGADPEDSSRAGFNAQTEAMRLDAVQAESQRKTRAKEGRNEVGLPSFQEYEREPLVREHPHSEVGSSHNSVMEASNVHRERSSTTTGSTGPKRQASQGGNGPFPGGYAGGTPGSRAVDNYWSTNPNVPSTQPHGTGASTANTTAAAAGWHASSPSPPPPQRTNYQNLSNRSTPTPVRQPSFGNELHNYNDPYGRTAAGDPVGLATGTPKPTRINQHANSSPSRQNTDPFDPFKANDTYSATPGEIYEPRRQNSRPTGSSFQTGKESTTMPAPDIYNTRFPPPAAAVSEVYNSRSPPISSPPQQQRQQMEYYDPYAQKDRLHSYPTRHSPPTHSPSPVSAPHGLHIDPNAFQPHGGATTRSPVDETTSYGLPYDTHRDHEMRTGVGQQQQQPHDWTAVVPESVEETSHSGEMLPEYNPYDPNQSMVESTSSGSGAGVAYGVTRGYGYPREKQ